MEWNNIIVPIQGEPEMLKIKQWLSEERRTKSILPDGKDTWNAFSLCPYDKTRVVILGQDPYPNKIDAHGLAFSSNSPNTPSSLQRVFQEIHRSLYPNEKFQDCFKTNNLSSWASQGVLLLNTTLTVEEGNPGSHIGRWNYFSARIMKILNEHPNPLVFLLWGKQSQKFAQFITDPKHLILEDQHPSPMSGDGFIGNNHFIKVQQFLSDNFWKPLVDVLIETKTSVQLAEIMGRYLINKGLRIEVEELNLYTKFIISKMPIGLEIPALAIKPLYQINFRTV